MVTIFKGYRPRIARKMVEATPGDKSLKEWLNNATFAKVNGYYMAWKADSFFVLPPDGRGETFWFDGITFEEAVSALETGEYCSINLQIEDPVTGEWR